MRKKEETVPTYGITYNDYFFFIGLIIITVQNGQQFDTVDKET